MNILKTIHRQVAKALQQDQFRANPQEYVKYNLKISSRRPNKSNSREQRTRARSRIRNMSSIATDNNAIAAALQALAAAISALRPAAASPKVYDPFASTEAFDLSS